MKKIKNKSYVLAAVLMVAAVSGMTGVYFMQQKEDIKKEPIQLAEEEPQKLAEDLQKSEEKMMEQTQTEVVENTDFMDNPEIVAKVEVKEVQEEVEQTEETASSQVEKTLHFETDKKLSWPVAGEVLMNYSMDKPIYFKTLEQYKYNPAVILKSSVNERVTSIAEGEVLSVDTNEVTGCTVTVDLGDGYQAIYGQLKEVNLQAGERIAQGQTIGYISEPTKYYSLEGSNLYFEMKKEENNIDPKAYFE